MKIKIVDKKNYKSWRKWAIVFMVFFLVSAISISITGNSIFTPKIESTLCNKIKGTPAWVKDGEIVDYGYKEEWKTLPDGYFFYYDSRCYPCHRQIENFGEEYFSELKEGGYVIDCMR